MITSILNRFILAGFLLVRIAVSATPASANSDVKNDPLWNLLAADTVYYTGLPLLFYYGSNILDSESHFDRFIRDPEVKKMRAIGNKTFEEYINVMVAGKSREISEINSLQSQILASFDQTFAPESEVQYPTILQAESTALAEIHRRYPQIQDPLSDHDIVREYKTMVQRELLREVPKPKYKKIDPDVFKKWIAKWSDVLIAKSVESEWKGLISLHRSFPEQFFSERNRFFLIAEQDQSKVSTIYVTKSEIESLRQYQGNIEDLKLDVEQLSESAGIFLVDSSNQRWAVKGYHYTSPQDKTILLFNGFPARNFSLEVGMALEPAIEQDRFNVYFQNKVEGWIHGLRGNLHLVTYNPDPQVLRTHITSSLKFFFPFFNKPRISLNTFGHSQERELEELKWWGFSKSPDYWVQREEWAEKIERPEFQFDIPQRSYDENFEMQNSKRDALRKASIYQIFGMANNSESLAAFAQVLNVPIEWKKYKKIRPDALPKDDWLWKSPDMASTHQVTPLEDGGIMIPSLYGMRISEITLSNKNSRLNLSDNHFALFYNKNAGVYAIKLAKKYRNASYTIHIKFDIPRLDELPNIPISEQQLFHLINELEESGLTDLSEGLQDARRPIDNVRALWFDLKAILRYTYIEESHSAEEIGEFGEFARFVDPESGWMCLQCDGTARLLAKILNFIFQDEPGISAKAIIGHSINGQYVMREGHAITEFNYRGKKYWLDGTPFRLDPRMEARVLPIDPIPFELRLAPKPSMTDEHLKSWRQKTSSNLDRLKQNTLSAATKVEHKYKKIDPHEPFGYAMRLQQQVAALLSGQTVTTGAPLKEEIGLAQRNLKYLEEHHVRGYISSEPEVRDNVNKLLNELSLTLQTPEMEIIFNRCESFLRRTTGN